MGNAKNVLQHSQAYEKRYEEGWIQGARHAATRHNK